jgi:hypothetical protein
MVGDQAAQPLGEKIRIAVGGVDRPDQGRPHGRQRREWIFIQRQREWIDSAGILGADLERVGHD